MLQSASMLHTWVQVCDKDVPQDLVKHCSKLHKQEQEQDHTQVHKISPTKFTGIYF